MRSAFEAVPGSCPTCGFPPGQAGWLRSDLPPGHPKFGALVRCPDCCDATLSERLRGSSQLTGWLRQATFESYRATNGNADARQAALDFARARHGWLTLWGSYGPGKTHLLAAAVNQCTDEGVAAVYYTLPDLLDRLRQSYGDNQFSPLFDRLVGVPVLALDEVDKVRLTDWALEKIYQLVDARYRDMDTRATAFAMNVQPDPADEGLGYLYSRMSDRRNKVVEVGGGDVRPVR